MGRVPKSLRERSLARLGSDVDLRVFGEAAGGQVAAGQCRAGARVIELRAACLFGFGSAAFVAAHLCRAGVDVGLVGLTRADLVVEIIARIATTGYWKSHNQKRNESGECQSSHMHRAKTSTASLVTAQCYRKLTALQHRGSIHLRTERLIFGRARLNQAFLRGASAPMSVARYS